MVAPLSQESDFKREFDKNRLAALRGDDFSVPLGASNSNFFNDDEGSEGSANNDRYFSSGSEDGILAQYPLATPFPGMTNAQEAPDPQDFAFLQQRARMEQGIGAPLLIPEDTASLLDPEFSTEEQPVTFGESLQSYERQAQQAEDLESIQAIRGAVQNKMNQATEAAAEQTKEWLKEKTSRWTAKAVGNGSNALDSMGWDAWITFFLSYIYLMTRGAVSLLAPETQAPENFADFQDAVRYNAKKVLHIFIPVYRPFQEPGDFLYFLFLFFMSGIVIFTIVAVFITIFSVFSFPAFLMGSGASTP